MLRLEEVFEQGLHEKRTDYSSQTSVLESKQETAQRFKITIGYTEPNPTILSKSIILATGRFIGGEYKTFEYRSP
jgi:hypothetical protein